MKRRFFPLAMIIVMTLVLLAPATRTFGIREAVSPLYDRVGDFHEGFAVAELGGKVGLINQEGREVISFGKYEEIHDFSEGLAAVCREGKWGYLDSTGREAIPCTLEYAGVGEFHEGFALVLDDENRYGFMDRGYGFINREGQEVIPCRYIQVSDFSEGLAMVISAYDWSKGFIDTTGQEVISCQYKYDWMHSFSQSRAAVRAPDGTWGFIDRTGREVVPCQYTLVHDFSEGLALVVTTDNKWGYIDLEGNEVIPPQYGTSGDFSQGLAVVSSFGGEVAVIEKTGQTVVSFGRYSFIRDFREGLAAARNGEGLYGFIDQEGREVIACRYDYAESFSGGLAIVCQWGVDGGYGFVDRMGREVVPCVYDEARDFSEGLGAIGIHRGEYQDSSLHFRSQWGFLSLKGTAYVSTQTVGVDGATVEFHAYALRDTNGDETNYVRLRDVAMALNGSAAQFQVGWDGAVKVETGIAYTPDGSEGKAPFSGDQTYETAVAPTHVNGEVAALDAIILKDDRGGSYTYYRLRDLGAVLGFAVDWSADGGITIETKGNR